MQNGIDKKSTFFIIGLICIMMMGLSVVSSSHAADTYLLPHKTVDETEIWKKGCEQTPQTATVTLTLTGAGECPLGGPLDIMLIIDRSTTMLISSRIDSAKAAAIAFVEQLRGNDRCGLVSFAGDVTLDKGLAYMDSTGRAELKTAIEAIDAYGKTNIGDAIRTSNHELEDFGRPDKGWVEILLSDGLPNRPLTTPDPVNYALTAADTARILNVPIYTIGLALTIQAGIDLLQDIADTTGGIYYDSPTPQELRQIFIDIAGVIICNAATDIVVTDVVQGNFNLENAFTLSPNSISVDPVSDEKTLIWYVPDIEIDSTWSVSFDISSDQVGTGLPVDVYGDSKVVYSTNGTPTDTVFPQANITVFECLMPELQVLKSDALFNDADGNSVPSPGDIIKYTVVITNNGDIAAVGAAFSDTPDINSALVVGSVTTTQGTVTTGNTGGDTSVGVTIGTIPISGTVTITFQVTIDHPFPVGLSQISNQGFVSSDQLPTQPSDDPDTGTPNDPTITPVTAAPDIRVTKTDGVTEAEPGTTLLYTITIENIGNQGATSVQLTDTLDTHVTYQSATGGGIHASGIVTWSQFDLAVGATETRTVTVTVKNPLPAGVTQIVNVAYAEDDGNNGPDPNPGNNKGTDVDTVIGGPDIQVTKTDNVAMASPGDQLTYTITVSNIGKRGAVNVALRDTIDQNVTYGSAPGGSHSGGIITWPAFDLAVGATVQKTVTVTVKDPLPSGVTQILNIAYAEDNGANGPDSNPSNNRATDVDGVVAAPDIQVTKTDNVASTTPGAQLTYTITVSNIGNRGATNVSLKDTLDPNVTFGSAPGGNHADGVVTWTDFDLAVGASVNKTVTVTVKNPLPAGVTQIVNVAYAKDDGTNGTDPNPNNNRGTDVDDVTGGPDIQVTKTDNVTSVSPGDQLTYTITVSNIGIRGATAVALRDTLDPNVNFFSSPGGGHANGIVSWSNFNLAAGSSTTRTVTVTVDDPIGAGVMQILNIAAAYDDGTNGPDSNLDNNRGTDIDAVVAAPDIQVTKTDNVTTASPGDQLTYTITVSNTGHRGATDVALRDTLDPNVTYISSSDSGVRSDRIVSWPNFNLAVSSSVIRTVTVSVKDPLPAGITQIRNAAIANDDGSNGTDPDPENNYGFDIDDVIAAPDIRVRKTDGVTTADPGDQLTYTITVSNIGDRGATDVALKDTLDQNVSFVSASGGGTYAGGIVSWPDFDLAVGDSVELTATVTIDDPLPAGITQIVNIAGAFDDGTNGQDPNLTNNVSVDTDTVTSAPLIEATKVDALFMDNDDDGVPSPGDVLRYAIVITNSGNTGATGVLFEDTPGDHTSLVVGTVTTTKGSILSGNTVGDTHVSVDIGGIAGGGSSVTISFRVSVASPLPVGVDSVANQGFVITNELDDEPTDDPATPEEDDETVTPLRVTPIIEATKRDALFSDNDQDGLPSPGDVLAYEIRITNSGNQAASGVVFTDTPDLHTFLVVGSVTTSQGTVNQGNNPGDTSVTINIGTILGGGEVQIGFHVLVESPYPPEADEQVVNQGFVGTNELDDEPTDDPDTPAEDDETITELAIEAVLEATKRDTLFVDNDQNDVPSPGDILQYEIVISNSGNAGATGVLFTDTPGAYTKLLVGSVTTTQGTIVRGNGSGHTSVRVDIGSIAGGNAATVTFQVTIDDPLPADVDRVANQGLVRSDELDDEPTDDPDTPEENDETITPVEAAPFIEVIKNDILIGDSDGNGEPSPGDTLLYDLTLVNLGNMNATGVIFEDTPDPNSSLIAGTVTTTQGTVLRGNTPGQTDVRIDIGPMLGGATVTITFQIVIHDPFPPGVFEICNQGIVTTDQTDPEPTDDPETPADDDETDTPVLIAPVIESYKRDRLYDDRDHDGQPTSGDLLLYTVTIFNSGNTAATGAFFEDTPDPNTTLIAGSVTTSAGSVVTGNTFGDVSILVDIGSIPGRGGEVVITFQVAINDPLPVGVTFVANQGFITNDQTEPEPTDDPDTPQDDDPTVTRAFWIIFKRGNTFPEAVASTFCPYIDLNSGFHSADDTLVQITTYTYDPDFDLWWEHPADAGDKYPGSHLYITYRFRTGTPVDSIFTSIPARGSSNPARSPKYRVTGPNIGKWEVSSEAVYDYYGYDWTVYDEADRDDGLWQIISDIYISWDGSTLYMPDTSYIIFDSKDPVYHLTYKRHADNIPLKTVLHPTLGTIPVTRKQKVLITTTVDQTLPVIGNGRLWSWMNIFIFAQGENIDIDGVPSYADELIEEDRWVNDAPPNGDTLMYYYTWNLQNADATCDGIAEVRIKGRDTASNLVDIEDGEPNIGLHILVDVTPPRMPDASKITATNDGSVWGIASALGQDWYGLGLTVKVYRDQALNTLLVSGPSKGDGSFGVIIPTPVGLGDVVYITAVDLAGNESGAAAVTVDETVIALEAFKQDQLVADNDWDGEVTAGDVLGYSVLVTNMSNSIAADLTDIEFFDAPDVNTTLNVGSVTTTRGTVLEGNTLGDTDIRVFIGPLIGGRSATITFRVTVNDPLPPVANLENQGLVVSNEMPDEPTDDPDTPADDDATVTPVPSGAIEFTYTMEPGWNLISVPVVPASYEMAILFPDALSSWGYTGAYVEATLTVIGQGYFQLYNQFRQVEVVGYPLESYTTDVNQGWNLIGSLIDPVALSSVTEVGTGLPATDGCLVSNSLYGYHQGQYYRTNSLEPGNGHWVFALYGCTIEVESSGSVPAKEGYPPLQKPQWLSTLKVDWGHQSTTLEFGQDASAGDELDGDIDILSPPPLPGNVNRAAFQSNLDGYKLNLLRDIRNLEQACWTLEIDADEKAKVSWDVSEIPAGYSVKALYDGYTIDMRDTESVMITGSTLLKIDVNSLPNQYDLVQNYPNPFNPTTTIQYAVCSEQSPAHISLKIYNLLGQEVRTLVDETREAGYYTVTWDGRDDWGSEVASGVYFYRLTAGEYSAARRMVLMK